MPIVTIPSSPLRPGAGPVRIFYRESGAGRPLLLLHGGWGDAIYPFDRQAAALGGRFHLYGPDRSGYGGSGRLTALDVRFHQQAAAETFAVLDALGLDRVSIWGHSDGAVIGVQMALERPARCDRLILEAFHFYRHKPGSRAFFAGMAADPDTIDARVARVLAAEHGEDYWRTLIRLHGRAWLALADERPAPGADLYDGRLSDLRVPVLILHGRRDPRTEPGEIEAVRQALPDARVVILEQGGHSPHAEAAAADDATRAALAFLDEPEGEPHGRT